MAPSNTPAAWKRMFVCLEFTDEAAKILVEREKIVKMNTLRKMDRKRIDATC